MVFSHSARRIISVAVVERVLTILANIETHMPGNIISVKNKNIAEEVGHQFRTCVSKLTCPDCLININVYTYPQMLLTTLMREVSLCSDLWWHNKHMAALGAKIKWWMSDWP